MKRNEINRSFKPNSSTMKSSNTANQNQASINSRMTQNTLQKTTENQTYSNNNAQNKESAYNKSKSSTVNPEDDYITNLQKQIYYLELEMKLMRDRELETKNKIGGYEILFRDGVPLNEHFLALKTKYTSEKDVYEKKILEHTQEIQNIENENKYLQQEIDNSNKNYYDLSEKLTSNTEYYKTKIFELNAKVINENNLKTTIMKEKENIDKQISKYTSDNLHANRVLEKMKLFSGRDNKDEKNKQEKDKMLERLFDVEKLVLRTQIDHNNVIKRFESNTVKNQIEEENTSLIFSVNKLEREFHMAKAKKLEQKNLMELNKKQLIDEELKRLSFEKENKRLNEELDNLAKMNDEALRTRAKENEQKQIIIVRDNISNNENKMNNLLEKYKDEETKAKELLEDKDRLTNDLIGLKDVIESQRNEDMDFKRELIDVKNAISELNILIEENKSQNDSLWNENKAIRVNNEKTESDIISLKKKMEEVQSKIELNTILKDVDLNELKQLSQNNAMVNNSINTLINKWDKVYSKLQDNK